MSSRSYGRGFGCLLFAAVPTTLFFLLTLGPATEAYCTYCPEQEKLLRHLNGLFTAEFLIGQGTILVVGDTGWTEAIIYMGKKQYLERTTELYWILLGVCIGFVILLFAWKPIQNRYRRYRRNRRRRQQKDTSRV